MVQVKETVTANNQVSIYVASYDGDGRKVSEILQEDPTNTNGYIVCSTVLGGKPLTRLNNLGNKVNMSVPIDDRITPVIIGTGSTGSVGWSHRDPLGLSEGGDTKAVYDAFGNRIAWQPVPTGPSPLTYPRTSASMSGVGSSFGSGQDRDCVFNDLPISCRKLAHLMDIGVVSAVVGRTEVAIDYYGFGIYELWIKDQDGKKLGQRVEDEDDRIVINHDEDDKKGHYEYFFIPVTLKKRVLPKNRQPLPTDLKDRVANIVNNPETDCAGFIKKLIGNLGGMAFSDDPMKLFERVEEERGFTLGDTGKYGGVATITGGKRQVKIRPVDSSTDPKLSEHQAYAYAMTALNELMHQAKKSGVYTDRQLAVAIFPLLSSDMQAANPLPNTSDVDTNSTYFHSLFNLHCRSLTGE